MQINDLYKSLEVSVPPMYASFLNLFCIALCPCVFFYTKAKPTKCKKDEMSSECILFVLYRGEKVASKIRSLKSSK